jgi:hypothetical protein
MSLKYVVLRLLLNFPLFDRRSVFRGAEQLHSGAPFGECFGPARICAYPDRDAVKAAFASDATGRELAAARKSPAEARLFW